MEEKKYGQRETEKKRTEKKKEKKRREKMGKKSRLKEKKCEKAKKKRKENKEQTKKKEKDEKGKDGRNFFTGNLAYFLIRYRYRFTIFLPLEAITSLLPTTVWERHGEINEEKIIFVVKLINIYE